MPRSIWWLLRGLALVLVCGAVRLTLVPRPEHIATYAGDAASDWWVNRELMYAIFRLAELWMIPLYLFAAVAFCATHRPLVATLTLQTHRPSRPLIDQIGFSLAEVLALAVCLGGCWLRQAAYDALGRMFTFAVTIQEQHQLITTGPYTYLVHPSYTGASLCFLGFFYFIGFRSLRSMLLFVVMTLALLPRIFNEEAVLAEAFGAQWHAFVQSRWRLYPPFY
jgi:protein-S-isoprenylcysteine O-methyltransferase Ste14